MNNNDKLYCGSGKEVTGREDNFIIELNLTQLWEHLSREDVKAKLNTWESRKTGVTNKTLKLYLAPMKPENQNKFKSHSLKIINWESQNTEDKGTISQPKPQSDDIPF